MTSNNCAVALRLARAGLHVFPCSPDKFKKPTVRGSWRDNSTTDPQTIETWWRIRANHLVALDLHKAGVLVLDGDRHPAEDGVLHHDGVDELRRLFRKNKCSFKCNPITITPSGGVHVYFANATGFGNREGDLPDGINVRGSGGYAVAPGCALPDGRRYAPVKGFPDLSEAFKIGLPALPPWLAELIQGKPGAPAPAPIVLQLRGKRFERYAAAALNRLAGELSAKSPESGRNCELNFSSWKMGTMIARGWISQSEVEHVLYQAAECCALVRDTGPRSVKATIASGLNAGLSRPHPDLGDR